jgi:hypothetical protein
MREPQLGMTFLAETLKFSDSDDHINQADSKAAEGAHTQPDTEVVCGCTRLAVEDVPQHEPVPIYRLVSDKGFRWK